MTTLKFRRISGLKAFKLSSKYSGGKQRIIFYMIKSLTYVYIRLRVISLKLKIKIFDLPERILEILCYTEFLKKKSTEGLLHVTMCSIT